MVWGTFYWHGLGPLIPLEGRNEAVHYVTVLSDHLRPTMQHFFPVRTGVFQDIAPVHQAHVVTRWFEEHKVEVTHPPWPSQLPDLNPIEHLWDCLKRCLRQRFLPTLNQRLLEDFLVEEWCHVPAEQFQTLVNCMSHLTPD